MKILSDISKIKIKLQLLYPLYIVQKIFYAKRKLPFFFPLIVEPGKLSIRKASPIIYNTNITSYLQVFQNGKLSSSQIS